MNFFFERAAKTLRSGLGPAVPSSLPLDLSADHLPLGASAASVADSCGGTSQSPSMSSIGGAVLSDAELHDADGGGGDTDDDVTDTEDDSGIVDNHHQHHDAQQQQHRHQQHRQHRLELAERAKRFFPDLGIDESMAGQQGTTLNSFLTYW